MQYRKLHNGQALPAVKDKRDIFNGNVHDAGGFLLAYISSCFLVIGCGICFAYIIWFCPYSAINTIEQTVIFENGIVDDDAYVMTTANGETYKVVYWNEREENEKIQGVCDGITEVIVFVEKIKDKRGGTTKCWSIQQIQCDDTVILSFEESNRLHQKHLAPLVLIPIVLAIILILCIIGSIIVGRNPKKYKCYVKFFFKSGYIKQ
ncbi:MAG: hypothetical protein IKX86_01765 [Clostridia bacterium]|nr:hypothetical protein [Clostridia bacterium]MBR5767392.1 hypothetical protein [Clostridia bacterium]